METVGVRPERAHLRSLVIGLCLLCAVILFLPPLSFPLALALPLLACPLVGQRQEPLVYVAAAIPTVSALMAGLDTLYAVSLALVTLLPLAVTKWLPTGKRVGPMGALWYMGAVAAGLLSVLASATHALGGPLWRELTALWIDRISRSERAGLLLYRFAAAGLIPMPEGQVLMHVFEPAMIRQLLFSLRRTLEGLLFDGLPMLFIQGSMIVGLFTSLRVQRTNGIVLVVEAKSPSQKTAHLTVPAGFRLIAVPNGLSWPLTLMALSALLLWLIDHPLAQILGQLCYTTFETAFALVGAAVFVCVCTVRHPRRKTLFGVLAAALYVFAPFVLFLIGLTDQNFHYRVNQFKPADRKKGSRRINK